MCHSGITRLTLRPSQKTCVPTEEFAAALVGNASATNSTWRLNFGFVLLKGNVSYELLSHEDGPLGSPMIHIHV